MHKFFLLSKLHHARITEANLEYEGSFSIDEEIMTIANIHENEQLHIYNLENGERFSTYAIIAPHGSRIMQANGACAHKVKVGDRVIICTYGMLEFNKTFTHRPTVLLMDEKNNFSIKSIK